MTLRTSYEFTLPRGYVDPRGGVHRTGVMRLATARDELEPLRDPTISGPEDPRLTILVLARVVERLGDLDMVTPHEIEGLFAVDLAFLQDFYGVINFGNQAEYEALLRAQQDSPPPPQPVALADSAPQVDLSSVDGPSAAPAGAGSEASSETGGTDGAAGEVFASRPSRRHAIEEIRPAGR